MSDMLFSCGFNWQTCTANDFSYFFDTFYGNCFTFNSGMKANGSTTKYLKSAIPGPIYGLTLTLFLGDPILQSSYQNNGNGIAIVVHNQTGYPSFGSRRILASAGMETDIAINRNFVSKLGGNYGSCLQDVSSASFYAKKSEYFNFIVNKLKVTYDQILCYSICFQDKVIQECNCSVGTLPDYKEVNPCTIFDIDCAKKIVSSFFTADSFESCDSNCPVACSYIEYSTKASSVSFPNEYFKTLLMNDSKIIATNISYDKLDKAFLKVNIFYESMSYTQTIENPALTFETFISNIGGILGLFIGISVLSFLEIIDLFVYIVLAIYEYRKSFKTKIASRVRRGNSQKKLTNTNPKKTLNEFV
jgi:hypothetical protein